VMTVSSAGTGNAVYDMVVTVDVHEGTFRDRRHGTPRSAARRKVSP